MEKAILERILGHEKLVAIYGYWPSFHDSEILTMRMDRASGDDSQGPVLWLKVHLFHMTAEVDPMGHYKTIHHAIVDLKMVDVENCELIGFNHQNVLNGLTIEEAAADSKGRNKLLVELDPAYGLGGELNCASIEIGDIEFRIPENSVYDKK